MHRFRFTLFRLWEKSHDFENEDLTSDHCSMGNSTLIHSDLLAIDVSWIPKDLELFENEFDFVVSMVCTIARGITFAMAIIVHRAFYRLVKRLPGRAFNQVIYPYMVSKSVNFKTTLTARPRDMQPWNVQILRILGNMNSRYSVFPGPNDHVTQSLDVCKTIIVTADLDMNSWIFFKQVMLSIFLFPYSLYLSLAYWIYPLKDNIGDTGCYVAIYGRDIGTYVTQTHSFFMAMFRYNCLFNGTNLKKINLGPNVSLYVKLLVNLNQLLLHCSQYSLKWGF